MRKFTADRARAEALAQTFRGLPEGYTRFALCDDLHRAREPLALDSDALWLLIFYIKRTQDQDWLAGAAPVVAWPKFEIACVTGWSEDKISRVENRLCDLGLIAFVDGTNCKRKAYRDTDGALGTEAVGISLAPVGARAAEISATGHEKLHEIAALRRVFGALFELRARLGKLASAELPRAVWERLSELLADLPKRRDPRACRDVLERLRARAQAFYGDLCKFLGVTPLEQPERAPAAHSCNASEGRAAPSPAAEIGEPSPRAASVRKQAAFQSAGAASVRRLYRTDAVQNKPESNHQSEDQDLLEVLKASPALFREYVEDLQRRQGGRWDLLLDAAADRYGQDLALKQSLVGRLRRTYGRMATLRSLFDLGRITERGGAIRNPGGYAVKLAQR